MANSVASVAALEGQAWAKAPDGTLRPLKVGDTVTAEETVITATGARIELDFGDGQPVTIAGNQEVLMNRDLWTDLASDKQDAAVDNASVQEALTVLNNGGDLTTLLDETAAGLEGGGGSNGHDFVALTRVIEETSPDSFTFGINNPDEAVTIVSSEGVANRGPQVDPQSFTGNEDNSVSGQVIATDPENDTLTYTLVGQPTNGVVTLDPATGTFVYTPNANYNGPDSFVVTVTDDHGNATNTTVGLTVTSVNDAPSVSGQTITTSEDIAIAGQVVANDVEGDALSYSVSTVALHGTVTINAATGAFVYTPNSNYNGADSFVVSVADGNGAVTTSIINVGVTSVNDLPFSGNQTLATNEDTPLNGQVIATDVDGDTLAYQVTTAAAHGQVALDAATGKFVYTPNANYNGADSFTVTVSDGKGGTTTSLINVGVAAVNDLPSVNNPSLATAEDTPVVGTITASDVDGDTLTYALVAQPANGTVALNPTTGQFTFTPNTNYNGNESFQVTVSDGKGGVVTSTVSVAVATVNDVPATNAVSVSGNEDSVQTITLSGTDSDGSIAGFVINNLPANGTLYSDAGLTQQITAGSTVSGTVYFAPNANWNGSTSFNYSSVDNQGAVDPTPAQVSITVAAVNDAPVANPDLASTAINQTVSVDVLANDGDVDNATSSLTVSNPVVNPAQGTAVVDAQGKIVFTPANNFTGPATISYTITDPSGLTSTSTLTVNVGTNTAPNSADKTVTLAEDGQHTFSTADFAFTDADAGQTLNAVRIDSLPVAGSLTFNGVAVTLGQVINATDLGGLVFTPVANGNGANYANFTFSVQDSFGGFDAVPNAITLSVTPVNDAPIAESASLTLAEDSPIISGSVGSSDVDVGATATYSLNGIAPAGLTFNADGSFSFDASNAAYQSLGVGQQTVLTLTYTVTDDQGATSTANLVITVTGTNDAPVAQAVSASATEDAVLVTGSVTSTDIDANATATYSLNGAAPAGLIFNANGTYSFDASNAAYQNLGAGQQTVITIPYTVTDDQGATSTANLVITITGTDDLPVISTGTGAVVEDTTPSATGTLTATDADNAGLAFVPATTSGSYGSLVLQANGQWTYTLDGRAQALAAGETKSEAFAVTLNDGSTTTVTVGITGTDDAPVISTGTGAVVEDTTPSATGNLTATDADNAGLAFVPATTSGSYGSLVLQANGQWTYTLDARAQALVAGETKSEVFTVTLNDGSTTSVTVGITGTDDAPVISTGTGAVVEDTTPSATGTLTATDADNAGLAFVPATTSGSYGSLVLQANGQWTYTLDGRAQSLAAGETKSEVFTVTLNDGSTTSVTVGITGTDDAPVISTGTGAVVEDTTPSATGTLTATDADNAVLAFVPGTTSGSYGSLVLQANGQWTYTLDARAQALAAGETKSEVFTVTLNDGSTTTVTVGITGTDDAPVISTGTGAVVEDTTPSATGTLTATDADNAGLAFVPATTSGSYGSLVLQANGQWAYTLDGRAQALAAGETKSEIFTVTLNDGSTTTVTVGITGTDDAPVISTGTGAVVEDTTPSATGTLTATDADNAGLAFVPATTSGSYGSLVLQANGQWTYTLYGRAQALAAGETKSEVFTVTLNDGSTTSVTVGITGTDDAPVISTGTGAVVEDTTPSATGTLTATDADNAGLAFVPATTSGNYGSLVLQANGQWTYTLDARAQALAAGETKSEAFAVTLNDGSTTTVTVGITGTDDAPVISAGAGSVVEDTTPSASGTLTATDADNAGLAFVPATTAGNYGSLVLQASGQWTYTLDGRAQALAAGETKSEVFTVTLNDGSTTSVTVGITGTDDAPVISSGTGAVVEDTTPSATGTLTATDADNAGLAFVPATTSGSYGSLVLQANGQWTYTLDARAQALAAGETKSEVFTVTLNDGSTTTVTVGITGTDDAPVISTGTGAVVEDTTPSATGTLTATDADNAGLAFVPATTSGSYGSLVLQANGQWTYTLDGRAQALAAGETKSEAFAVTLNDGSTTTVTVGITGTDDAPVISAGTGSVVEDTTPSATGTLTATDADNAGLAFVPATTSGSYGSLVLQTNGQWTYTLDGRAQALAAGETKSEVFTVTLNDGSTTNVTVGITGTDDAPVISTGTGSVVEDTTPSATGTLTATDADNTGLAFVPATTSGNYGSLVLQANGQWTYTLDARAQALAAGETKSEVFTVTLNDGSTTTVTVGITGTNDAAIVTSADETLAETNAPLTTSGTLTSSDVDNAANAFTPSSTVGTTGTLSIDASGNWTYTANSAFNNLSVGQSVNETFTVASIDGTTSTIKITISGTNDAPVAQAGSFTIAEDSVVVTGSVSSTDADAISTAAYSLNAAAPAGLTFNPDGTYSFDASNAAYQSLGAGQSAILTVAYTVTDDHGATSTANLVITVTGANDGPTTSDINFNTSEDVAVNGNIVAADLDGDSLNYLVSTPAAHGVVSLDPATGAFVYTPNANYNGSDTFAVTVSDGKGGTAISTVSIGIAAVTNLSAGNDSFTTNEDTALTGSVATNDNTTSGGTLDFTLATNVSHGTLVFNPDGSFTYTPATNYNGADSFTYTVNDATSGESATRTVTLGVTAVNDAAVVSSADVTLTETNAPLTTSGTLTSTDIDNPANTFTPSSTVGTTGTLSIDASGNWTYTANSAFDNLNVGQSVNETFTVASVDGTTSTIKITINGTNDAATVSSADVTLTETNAALTTSGTLISADVDNTANTFTPSSTVGTTGTLSIDASGNWTYTANSAFDNLNVGQSVNETFTVASVDGTTSTIKITINGTNDTPVISVGTGSVVEDTTPSASGTLTATDADNAGLAFVPTTTAGNYGSLVLQANGQWTYTLDARAQALAAGETKSEVFTVTLNDGSTTSVTVGITGTDDAPVISTGTGAVVEDTTPSATGTLTAADADNTGLAFVPANTSGSYGSLVLQANGQWTYTLDARAQALAAGETKSEVFTVTLNDGSTTTVTVGITGTDDVPVISVGAGSVVEDTTPSATGTLIATDTDNAGLAFVPATTSGSYGSLVLQANGQWTYTLDARAQALVAGETKSEVFTVTLNDGSTTSVTVGITGTDDAPVISTGTGSVVEDTTQSATGTLTATDADNAGLAFVPSTTSGSYGSLVLQANGQWTYTLDARAQALAAGETKSEVFTVTLNDGSTTSVTVGITGTDDAPVISTGTGSVVEDTTPSATATLTATDADNAGLAFVPTTTSGSYGSLVLQANGQWTYTLDGRAQALAAGETKSEVFTVTLSDGSTTTVTVGITGTDDAPVISVGTGSVVEDTTPSATGTLTASDADNAGLAFVPATTSGSYGSLVLQANGQWTYTLDARAQALAAGETKSEVFTVTLNDGSTTSVTVGITGTDDAPVISTGTGSVVEDTTPSATGTLTATDADNAGLAFVPSTTSGSYGSLVLQANGQWTYTLDGRAQALAAGETKSEVITVSLNDGSTTTVTVGITGTDDAPVISTGTGSVVEDTAPSASGTLTATDADNAGLAFVPTTTSGSYGSLVLQANGQWTYTLDGRAQALAAGETKSEVITVSLNDGSTTTVTVGITGTNDVPVAQASSFTVAEDAAVVNGSVNSTDVDTGATATYALNGAAPAGLTFNTNGTYSFNAGNAAYQSLAVGQSTVLTIPYTVTDDKGATSTANLVITVTGTNDAPVAQASSFTVAEDAAVVNGAVTSTDVDTGATATYALNGAAPAGLTFNTNGTYSFNPSNAAYQSLAVGQQTVITVPYTVTDDKGATSTANLVITVTGTNDAPVISVGTGSVVEDTSPSATGTLTATDADNAALAFVPGTTAGSYGSLVLQANGQWTYTLDSRAQALAAGETKSEVITVSLNDGSTTTVTVGITGTNDAPVAQAASFTVAEDAALVNGSVTSTDVDAGATATYALNGTAPAGLTFNTNGTYSFNPSNAAYQSLAVGRSTVLTIPYTVIDDKGATSTANLVITVTGTNDAPVAQASSFTVAEDAAVVSGSVTSTDVDAGATATYALNGAAPAGLTFNTNGTYSFNPSNAAYQSLAIGQSTVLTIPYTVTDDKGATSTANLVITVTGTNDAPVAQAASFTVAEDAAVVNGSVTSTDVDSGATATYALNGAAPAGLTFNTNGTYSFDASNAAYQSLGAGQQTVITVPYTVTDDKGATSTSNLVITVTGTNDAPVISVGTGSVVEDTTPSATGTLTATDADNAALAFVPGTTAGSYGSLVLQANGQWTYTLDSRAQALAAGETKSEVITVSLNDGSTTTVTVGITGTNDAPVAQASSFTVAEDAAVVNGSVTSTDVDAGAIATYALNGAAPAGLIFNTNGTYSFDASNAAYQSLGAGQQTVITVPYTVTDDKGATSTANLVITVTGTNDAPVISVGTGSVVEDTTPSASGILTATDADNAGLAFVPATTAGNYGSLVLQANGQWTYTLDGRAQALAAGETKSEVITVSLSDGSTTTVTVGITGTNDAPVAQAANFTVAEDAAVVNGSVTSTDVDSGATATYALSGAAPAGLTFNANGTYSFNPSNAAYQSLAVGQSTVLTIPYTVTDDKGATSTANLVITVTGTNDAPVAQASSFTVAEDTAVVNGAVTSTDVDAGATATYALNGAAPAGLTFNTNGTYSFNAGNTAYQSLAVGQSTVLTIPYTVTDDKGASSTANLVITVTGTNDAPVAQASNFTVAEDAAIVNGSVTSTDVDSGATATYALNGTAPAGLTFNTNGTYSFNPSNAAYQSLAVGQSTVLTIPYTVTDDKGATSTANLVITVTGTNDAPVAQASSFTVAEDAAVVNGSVTSTDVDAGATATYALNGAAPAGLTFNANGTYSFDASNAAYQSLGAGQQTVITVPYTVTDDKGATSTSNLVITVTGTNDAPVISVGTGSVVEDTTPSASGTLTATDADNAALAFVPGTTSGSYGSLVLQANGQWTYTLDGRAQALAAGETKSEVITVSLNDGSTTTVTVGITGTNDAPVAQAKSFTVAEDAAIVTGAVTSTDVDTGATATYALNGAAPAGLTFNTNGTYSFNPSNAAYQSLAVGQSTVLTIPYTVTDDKGATSTANLVITVTGTNDAPVAQAASFTVAEDAAIVNGSVTSTDVDAGATATYALNGAAPAGLTFNTNGTYSFNAGNAAYQSLAVGQSTVLTIPYTVTDDKGATSTANLVITVTGTNDAPVAQASSFTVAEDAAVVNGSVTSTDVDTGATATYALNGAAPAGLTFNTNGTYSFNPSNAAYQSLAVGQSTVLTIPYTVTDDKGASSTANLVITVTGTNDAPVAQAASFTVAEDAAIVNGSVTSTDVDSGATATYALNGAAPAGLTFNTNGTYSFNAGNSAYQSLAAGQSTVITIPYTVTDDKGATSTANLVITVTGTNDAPVAQAASFTVAEDAAVVNGSVTSTDVDSGATATYALNGAAPAGLTFNTNGTYSFNAGNAAYQSLAVGQSTLLTIPYTVTDDKGASSTANLVITVTGTNDAPVAQAAIFTVAEDAAVVNGAVTSTDVDSGATATHALNGAAPAGLTFNTNGIYSFNPSNAAYQSLGVGQQTVITVPYTVTDDKGATSTANLVITVTGTNDAPVAQAASFTVAEDAAVVNGSVTSTDVDAGATATYALNGAAPAGLTFNTNGTYSFNAGNTAYQSLAVGQSTVLTIPYTVTDDKGATSTANLVITVTGTNDAPVAQAASFTVAEDAAVVNGAATSTDVDAGATATYALNGAAPAGLTFNTNGTYSFNPSNAAYQSLGVGQQTVITVPYTVTDDKGATSTANLVITVTGTNDAPVAQASSFTVAEDAAVVNGSVTSTDVDAGATATYALNGAAPAGLTFNANGTYSFNAGNAAYQSLAVGQSTVLTIPYTVTDDKGATSTANLVITVTGTNDAPVAQAASFTVAEDAAVVNGSVTSTDVDTGATATYALNGAAPAGLTFNTNGTYSFNSSNAAYQSLGVGQQTVITVPYTVTDDKGATSTANLVITVTGTNDAAVVTSANVTLAETNAPLTTSGTLTSTDIDNAANTFTPSTTVGTTGTLSINAAGAWTYTANSAYNNLNVGQSVTETFTVASVDGTPSTVKITINGTNDAPVATAATFTGSEDATFITVSLAGTDVDGTVASLKVSALPTAAQGVLYLADGVTAVTTAMTLTPAQAAGLKFVPTLNFNGELDVPFTVTDNSSVVSSSANAHIVVTAVNDAPIANDDPTGTPSVSVGLLSQYYGYIEGTHGGNLASIAQVNAFISGRTPDATFIAKTFNYGSDNLFSDDLGRGTNLQSFLGSDAASLSNDPGESSDAVIRMYGAVELASGTYNFQVRGDDGYQIKVDGKVVALVDYIQSPTGTVHAQFTVSESGLHTIEVLYWDQGGQAVFKIELSDNNGTSYKLLSGLPTSYNAVHTMNEDTVWSTSKASLLANDTDVDNDTLSIVSVQNAQHGTVAIVGNNVEFTPTANYSGIASYTYTISDGKGGTSTATVHIDVLPINDAPVAVNDSLTATEDTAVTFTAAQLLGNDTDVDSTNLTISSVTSGTGGTVVLNANGTVTFTPTAQFNGNATFTYTTTDGSLTSNLATVTVAVASVNDAPAGTNSSVAIIEDQAYTLTVANFGFSDVNDSNALLAVKITTLPTTGVLYLNNVAVTAGTSVTASDITAGKLVYVPAQDATTSRFIGFQVQDTGGTANGGVDLDQSANTLTFTITDVPTANDASSTSTSAGHTRAVNLNAGNFSIFDGGGTDAINVVTTAGTTFTTLNFEHVGNNWELTKVSADGTAHVSVINQYVATNTMETLSFSLGGDYVGFQVGIPATATYNLNTTNSGTAGNDIIVGTSADDTITGGGGTGQDILVGGAGNDTITATGSGNHLLVGGLGNDSLTGGTGSDWLIGGKGNDALTGGTGADTFVWQLADNGTTAAPAVDTVSDFTAGAGGDKLNLSDLLQGEQSAPLTNYLHFTYDSATSSTTVSISSTGSFTSGNYGATDQTIVLTNVNLTTYGNDAAIINQLKTNSNLITD